MKKVFALVLTVVMLLGSLVGCGGKDKELADSELIAKNGKLVIGITDFAPMDYKDADGKWIGFDADMASKFAESLGVEAEFVEVNWDNKVLELDGKSIDCVWNGMTLTNEVKSAMDTSNPYFNNAQVVIVKKDIAENCKTVEDCKKLNFAVESGSAGQEQAEANDFKFKEVVDQATALQEVAGGTSEAAIIDYLMATAMVGEGTGFANLTHTVSLNSEEYGVGFRKGSDLVEKLNEFFKKSYADGSMKACADKYKIGEKLIEQK